VSAQEHQKTEYALHLSLISRTQLKYGLLLICAILLLFSMPRPCHAERKKKVLVLHSYHQGLDWTDNITSGIQDVFVPLQNEYEVYYEYLDTKRNSGEEYMSQMAAFVEAKNSQIEYEAIILSDNNALELLNDKKIHFRGDPPVIFCGINNFEPELISEIDEATGVAETTNHRATIELMHKNHPDHRNIVVIVDRTPTGDQINAEFNEIVSSYNSSYHFTFLRDFLLEEIPETLAALDKRDLIYILTFNRDRNGNFISYSEGLELIANHTNLPIYGSWDFYLGKGIIGGCITSGYLQGHTAAEQALQLLSGTPIAQVPIIRESPTRYMFDYPRLQEYAIDISQLPQDSLLINRPPSLFEQYKTTLLIAFFVAFVIALTLFFRNRRLQFRLHINHAEELKKTVSERTQELQIANRKLQQLSQVDDLSQLYNRRYFDATLSKEINRHRRSEKPLTLLICDIDFFKKYNDTYGHLAGDDCLRNVSQIISNYCRRESDTVARYGGEEFGVILPNTAAENATTIAENIRQGVESEGIRHSSSQIMDLLSISIGGVSIVPSQITNAETLIALADKALYQSKNNGRNQVTLHNSSRHNSGSDTGE
jgi:diguanylate cyclase (GGDEF)-like protein